MLSKVRRRSDTGSPRQRRSEGQAGHFLVRFAQGPLGALLHVETFREGIKPRDQVGDVRLHAGDTMAIPPAYPGKSLCDLTSPQTREDVDRVRRRQAEVVLGQLLADPGLINPAVDRTEASRDRFVRAWGLIEAAAV